MTELAQREIAQANKQAEEAKQEAKREVNLKDKEIMLLRQLLAQNGIRGTQRD